MTNASKLGLGTVQFGTDYGISNRDGQTSQIEVAKILAYALDVGIRTIDTASVYGISEEVLGKYIKNSFNIVSKFIVNDDNKNLEIQFEQSLKLLRQKSIYGYIAHRPSEVIENPILWEKLIDYKEKGLVRKIGFSFNEVEELEKILEAGFFPDLVQVPYNYFDNRFESFMIDLKSNNCEIHARSPFLQGLFFINPNKLPVFFHEAKTIIKELQKNKEDLPGMLMKYCYKKSFIDKVIIGVNNKNQLKVNVNSLDIEKELPQREFNIKEEIYIPSKWQKK